MKKIIISFVLLLAADNVHTMSMIAKRDKTEKAKKISIEAQEATGIETQTSPETTDATEKKKTEKKKVKPSAEDSTVPSKKAKLEAEKQDTYNT